MQELTLTNCNYCGIPTQNAARYCCQACELLSEHLKAFPVVEAAKNPFTYLDGDDFKALYFQGAKKDFDYVFYAEGLHCSSCVHLLEKLPVFYPGVSSARVNFGKSTVSVKVHEGASLAQIAYVIQELGYKPNLLGPNDDPQEKFTHENRTFLKHIGVAGFCAGNTMLFVVPVYAGLAGSWATVFNWISFFLFLPILFYSAMPFYRGAWNSLKYKVINVDLPIAIAMLSGFFMSTYNLVKGHGEIYFDSTASFLFFILCARYLLKRVQQNYLSSSSVKSFFKNEKYVVADGLEFSLIPWSKIQRGQVLKITRDQILPSDCELISAQAHLDMSLFNGESLPRHYSQGMELFAGTKVLNDFILVKVLTPFTESRLGKLLNQLDQDNLKKSDFVALTDRLAQKLIITVFAVAALFFLAYFHIDASAAFNRSLALIVLACPCALAFGSPLTFGLALKKGLKNGLLLKDSAVLEKLLKVKNIYFDKTGTLTEGNLSLAYSAPMVISEDLQKVILSLEAISYHPIAFALRKVWQQKSLHAVTDAKEVLGSGVSGIINGDKYEIKHLSESLHEAETAIEVFKNQESLCRLYFSDDLRSDSASAVQELRTKGMNVFVLSGDKKARVQKVAELCGIPKENVHAELFPEEKKEIILQKTDTCMIGDGANDSLCLQAADVGIAMKGSVDLSLQSADVYFTRGGLSPLFDLLNLSVKTRQVLIRNLTISLVYNSVGGTLALAGFINPMVAAILMPLSSLAIILSTLWGLK
ncbi:heavy metal translocating P-type ATPase [Bdellovibrio bacteriovorus]